MRRHKHFEFVTTDPQVSSLFPPVPAARCTPEWWRKTSPLIPDDKRRFLNLRLRTDGTTKACPGIVDYLSLGYIIQLWADILVCATPDEGFVYEWMYDRAPVGSFPPWQLGPGFPRKPGDHVSVLKIDTPWRIRVPRGWSILATGPFYHTEPRWTAMPGVIDSDRFASLNFIAEWHVPVGTTELLRAGTPLLHVIPFQRGRLPLEIKVSQERWTELDGDGVWRTGRGRLAAGTYRETGRAEGA